MSWIYELLFVLTFLQRGNVQAQLATERSMYENILFKKIAVLRMNVILFS
jgi:hypothetical protein